GVHTTSRHDDIVRIRRHHAAQGNVVDVIVGKLLPMDELLGVMKLHPPGAPCRGIRRPPAIADLLDRELASAYDPTRLPEPRIAVRADPGVGKNTWVLRA